MGDSAASEAERETLRETHLLCCGYGTDTNEIKNQTSKWRAEHPLLRVLAPLSVFAEVGSELRVIVGEPPIKADKGDLEEENRGQQREPVWFLDLPGQVTLPKRHPWLALREPDVEDEAELRFVQSHFGVRVDEIGASRAGQIRRLRE
ncbi:hypothetical protein BJV77DRAFT_1149489 [Russula vinacea]|nr:hypothetical protein BJV77DRAFT_1149489 [Russula vinacea]